MCFGVNGDDSDINEDDSDSGVRTILTSNKNNNINLNVHGQRHFVNQLYFLAAIYSILGNYYFHYPILNYQLVKS